MIVWIVFLCAIGGTASNAAAETHNVSIANLKFDPPNLTIKPGDTVTWTNNDDRDHAVAGSDGAFASGNLRHGETFSFKFDKPGKFPYGCKLHPRMKGTITVVGK